MVGRSRMLSTCRPDKQDLLFTPGPLLTSPRVKAPMAVDVGSRDTELIEAVKKIRSETLKLANGEGEYSSVIVQGSGTFGVESVLASWFGGPGQQGPVKKPLVCINGAYGKRAADIIKRYRGVPEIVHLEFNEEQQVDPVQVAQALKNDPSITDVYTIHSETTTGIVNDIEAIGKVIEEARAGGDRDICYTVDAMSSFGCYDCDVPAFGIDFLVTSANKCLQGVPGFTLVIGKKSRIEECKGKSPSVSLDLYDQMKALDGNGQFRFTPPTHTLLAFSEALDELADEGGIPPRRARYMANLKTLTDGMNDLGFVGLLSPERQGCIISTFVTPKDPNWDFDRFYNFLSDKGLVIYPGKLTAVDSFRIGTIGYLFPENYDTLLDAIREAIADMGVTDCSPISWTPGSTEGVIKIVKTK